MKATGLQPDVFTYTSLITCCGADAAAAMSLFAEMKAAGVAPNAITFNALLFVLGSAGEVQKMMQLFRWPHFLRVGRGMRLRQTEVLPAGTGLHPRNFSRYVCNLCRPLRELRSYFCEQLFFRSSEGTLVQ
jgi:Pentatricopeptide repeat domain